MIKLKRKPWIKRNGDDAYCGHCGGKSHWITGVFFRSLALKCKIMLTRQAWWEDFKYFHYDCVLRIQDVKPPKDVENDEF